MSDIEIIDEPAKTEPRAYSPEEKEEALRLYIEVGACEASRVLNIPLPTITSWARRSGVQQDAPPKHLQVAVETAKLTREQKREQLRELMLDKALDLLHRMDEPHKDFRGVKAEEVWFDKAPAIDCKSYATSAAILVDKFRLEVGEATSRTEEVTSDEAAAFVAGARAEWERNNAKVAATE